MRYLVDTDWIIDGLHGRSEALAVIEQYQAEGLGVSVITLGEVYEGAYNIPDAEEHIASFERFLAVFSVISLTDTTMRHFARLRAALRQQGNRIPDFDLLIAATAIDNDLLLLTRNRRHFERVPGLRWQ